MTQRREAAAALHDRFAESRDLIDVVEADVVDDDGAAIDAEVPAGSREALEKRVAASDSAGPNRLHRGVANPRHARLVEMGGWDGKS